MKEIKNNNKRLKEFYKKKDRQNRSFNILIKSFRKFKDLRMKLNNK